MRSCLQVSLHTLAAFTEPAAPAEEGAPAAGMQRSHMIEAVLDPLCPALLKTLQNVAAPWDSGWRSVVEPAS